MQQYSAYALLQEFKKQSELDIISIKNEFQKDSTYVIEVIAKEQKLSQDAFHKNPFYQKHLLTENSFLQIIKKDQVDTQIATMGSPFAIRMNVEDFKNQNDLYKFIVRNLENNFTIQEIRHNSFTVSVSFCDVLRSFIISSNGQTIICYDKYDINKYHQTQYNERACKVAQLFFGIYNKLNQNQQINLEKDLTHRSLIGCRNQFNKIEWYSIMEHYEQQRILSPDIVKKFLNHYKLETSQSIEYQADLENFPTICDSIYNQLIDQYHDYFQGKTIYFWKDNIYLGNCFIPSKHFEILRFIKKSLLNSKQIDDQLSQFNLNKTEYDFYQKFIKLILSLPNHQRSNYSFLNQSNIVFTCIYNNLDFVPQKLDEEFTLTQCLQSKSKIAVLIPVGIYGMGYDEISQIIFKNYQEVQIVSQVDQVRDNKLLYLYNQVCSLKKLKLINEQLKQLPYNVITVALYPECSHYYLSKKQSKFPFSFKFIMFCLLSLLDDRNKVNEVINQLKEFENQNLSHLPTDFQIACHYMPLNKETDDLYSEIVESDFKAAFSRTNEYLIESLSQYKDSVGGVSERHLLDQSKKIISTIEEKVKIVISKKKQQYIQNQGNRKQEILYGLYLKNPNWKEIDNFILDCLDKIVKKHPRDSNVNKMYHQLKEQLLKEKDQQIYIREKQPYMLCKKQEQKQWSTSVQVVVIVVDGIIILQPQNLGLNLLQDIPIYSNNIEVTQSGQIAELVRQEVEQLYNRREKEEDLLQLSLELNHKSWNVFIVKRNAIKIELVESVIH
ncbi:unnamed protein product [Paramecium sonneborni]|uniref:Uncharacterized protein n=1 Tax=Paramecium sonneborni TaxID=65129 RepID=A0A8S1MKZ0_9CILI|nr:unnamed protein product [Paramecium sonneborni]